MCFVKNVKTANSLISMALLGRIEAPVKGTQSNETF